jgi:hypothetical protein
MRTEKKRCSSGEKGDQKAGTAVSDLKERRDRNASDIGDRRRGVTALSPRYRISI